MAKEVKFNIKLAIDGKEQIVTATSSVTDLQRAVDGARNSTTKLKEAIINANQRVLLMQNAVSALQQFSSVINSITQESNAFTAAMKAANTMAGKDAAGFKELKSQVTELSKTIPIARDQLANGLYQVISNGVPEDNWIEYLNASARSAVGGIADVGEVVKVTATVIKNYGLEWSAAQDIQDKIQLTAKNGVTSFEQLAAALPSVTGQAAQLGVSFTEMLAVMSTLTGVTGETSEVATQLGSVLTALTKESSKSQKMAEAMGVSFNAASIKAAGGLRQYLQELDRTVTAYAQKTGMLKESIYSQLFGRAEALRLVNALTGNLSDKFAENIQALDNSAGTIDATFDEMASTGSAKLQMLKNKLGELTDYIATAVSGIAPALNFSSQIGLTIVSVISLRQAFVRLNATQLLLFNRMTKGMAAFALFGTNARKVAQAINIMSNASHSAAVRAMALKVAIRGLLVATGVGIAITALGYALNALMSSSEDATDALNGTSEAVQNLKNMQEQAGQEAAAMQVQLDRQAERLKRLMDSHSDTSAAVRELNQHYGQIFGTFNTAAEWYDVLISKSQSYCDQLRIEAESRLVAERRAQLSMDRRRNNREAEKLMESGDWGTNWMGLNNEATQAVIDENKRIQEEDQLLAEQEKDLERQRQENQAMGGVVITGSRPTVTTPATTDNKNTPGKNTGDNSPKLTLNPETEKQLADNVRYYSKQLEEANMSDRESIAVLAQKKRAAEEALKTYHDMIEALGVPADPKTLDDYDKKIQWLRKQRQTADKEAIAGIDEEISALESERQAFEDASLAAMRDDELRTYDELSRKQDYYNRLLQQGDEKQRAFAQAGIRHLNDIREAWEAADRAASVSVNPSYLNSLKAVSEAIGLLQERQKGESGSQVESTQREIERLEQKQAAIQLRVDMPSMEKELADLRALDGAEYRIKVREMGFDGIISKMRELEKLMENPDLADDQLEQLQRIRAGYEAMLKDTVSTFATVKSGWDSVKGIGSSVQGMTEALRENRDAWSTVTSVIDGFISIYEGITGIITIIQQLTAVSRANAAAKTAEAVAAGAAGTAEAAAGAGAAEAAAAEIPTIAVNKAAAQSFTELAAAAYFAAHASIPFAGFGIGAGFATAATAAVQAIGVMPFAEGGIVHGPTMALVGEYAGATNNPEVIAPLDKLRSMIQPSGVGGTVRFEIDGRKLVGVISNETRISSKSGRRTNITG